MASDDMHDRAIIEDLRRRLAVAEAGLRETPDAVEMQRSRDGERDRSIELQHRMRNMLALVRSITSRTSEGYDSVEDFTSHLLGRLDAFARTQTALTFSKGDGVDLELLVRDELLAQAASHERCDIGGPDVVLPARVANVLAFALHELATNATKFGALSVPDGRVQVSWRTDIESGEGWLHLVWEETGVPIAAVAPRRVGFGTEMIERRIAYESRGRGGLEFQPGGVRCTIDIPLPAA